jgi:hypothetical protein
MVLTTLLAVLIPFNPLYAILSVVAVFGGAFAYERPSHLPIR